MRPAAALVALVAACAGSPPRIHAARPSARDDLPLAVGSRWIYEGTHVTGEGTKPLRLVAEVEEVVAHGDVVAALVTNLPWVTYDVPPASIVARRGSQVWIVAAGDEALRWLRDPGAPLAALVHDAPPLLDLPLTAGAQRCDVDPEMAPMYCTSVEEGEGGPDLTKIAGLPAGPHEQLMVIYRTNPDDTEIWLVPGVGVTGYGYHHHGSLDDIDLRAVEVRLKDR